LNLWFNESYVDSSTRWICDSSSMNQWFWWIKESWFRWIMDSLILRINESWNHDSWNHESWIQWISDSSLMNHDSYESVIHGISDSLNQWF